jgi:hypothetical protein
MSVAGGARMIQAILADFRIQAILAVLRMQTNPPKEDAGGIESAARKPDISLIGA